MTKIRYKIIFFMVVTCAIMGAMLGGYNIYNALESNKQNVKEYRATLYEQFDRTAKLQVETASSLIQDMYNMEQKGLLKPGEARKRAADLVRNLRYDNGNYFWIDTTEGINVVLLGRDTEGKSRYDLQDAKGKYLVREINKNGSKEGGGYTDYWFPKPNETEPKPKRGYSLLFKPYNWVVGTGSWVDDLDKLVAQKEAVYQQEVKNRIIVILSSTLLSITIAALVAMYLSKRIADPIVNVVTSVQEVANGNLAVKNIEVTTKDEIGQLSTAFNMMVANLRRLIKEVSQSAELVAASSQQLTAGAEQTATAVNQVAETVVTVAQGAENQLQAVNETMSIVEEMSAGIQQIAANANNVASVADKTSHSAHDGKAAVGSAIRQMENIEKTVVSSAEVVTKLGERSKEIDEIVNVISGIAGQTNLLALNAAIEAARAGEQGRGFAVVAEEVRKLAEQSQGAAKQISTLIGEIQSETEHAVVTMKEGTREVKVGMEVVNTTGQAFNTIADMVNQLSTQIKEISAASQQMAGGSQQIVAAMRRIDGISKETAAQTQTVSAATEEQAASMEEIASSSQSLAKLAEQLQNGVSRFRA
jgi:methyl-accepting chemotaxis protein